MSVTLDHIVIACTDLEDGAAWVAARLGVSPGPGGRHPRMGTWNRLLGLGDVYLEVIAVEPGAEAPDAPRWFGLDGFAGPPRLAALVLRDEALAVGPGWRVLRQHRDALTWTIALPPDGGPPPRIAWGTTPPPPTRLAESGIRLRRAAAPGLTSDDPRLHDGPLSATISTPTGEVTLLG